MNCNLGEFNQSFFANDCDAMCSAEKETSLIFIYPFANLIFMRNIRREVRK